MCFVLPAAARVLTRWARLVLISSKYAGIDGIYKAFCCKPCADTLLAHFCTCHTVLQAWPCVKAPRASTTPTASPQATLLQPSHPHSTLTPMQRNSSGVMRAQRSKPGWSSQQHTRLVCLAKTTRGTASPSSPSSTTSSRSSATASRAEQQQQQARQQQQQQLTTPQKGLQVSSSLRCLLLLLLGSQAHMGCCCAAGVCQSGIHRTTDVPACRFPCASSRSQEHARGVQERLHNLVQYLTPKQEGDTCAPQCSCGNVREHNAV